MRQITTLIIVITLSFLTFGHKVTQAAEKPIVLKFAHLSALGGMLDQQARKFAELLNSKTKGRVKVDIYPAAQLGNIAEILEGVSMGTIDMVGEAEGFVEMFEKDFSILAVPFLMSPDELMKCKYLDELREKLRVKNNIRTLPGWGWRPPFYLWTQKRIVRTPDDLQGIKIRLWQQKNLIDMWNGLGATAIPMPWAELYMALAQGVVNGMAHNIVQIRDEKFYEQLNYCTLINWTTINNVFWINDKLYNKLPSDIQKPLDESSIEASNYLTFIAKSLEKEAREEVEKKGIKFIETDRDAWVKKARVLHKKLENEGAWSKGLLKKLGLE